MTKKRLLLLIILLIYLQGSTFFIYVNIIEYKYVDDTKAPLIRVSDSKQRLKMVALPNRANTQNCFQQLGIQKLLSKNFQSIEIQLGTQTGQLVPLGGTGKVILILNFKRIE